MYTKHELTHIFDDYGLLRQHMKKQEFIDYLAERTPFLEPTAKTKQRLWHVINDVGGLVSCLGCDKNVKWKSKDGGIGYSRFCSSKCSQRNPGVQQKREQTCIERFGYSSNLQSPDTKQQIRKTLLSKYGQDNISKTEYFREKSKSTFLKKYGVENPSQCATVQSKITRTHQERYGRKRQSQSHLTADVCSIKDNRELMHEWHINQKMPLTEIAELLGVNHSQLCVHFKTNLGIPIRRGSAISLPHKTVMSFLEDANIDYVTNTRKVIAPRELDILIPSKNIAIEVNGVAWHSELVGKKYSTYHLEKSIDCAAAGYQLIHIWDTDIKDRPQLVRNRLMSKLGLGKKIFARKCKVVSVDTDTKQQFLADNHIQGAAGSSVNLGLEHNGCLVAVMTFGRSRFNKKVEWELIRYCSAGSVTVVGGASRLFEKFVSQCNPSGVISYSDRMWNTGQLYLKLGFEFSHHTSPAYWYTRDFKTLLSRQKFQKHKLNNLLERFDSDLTEWQNMQQHGWDRVWDCGTSVYLWQP